MENSIHELCDQIENIAAINDATLVSKAVQVLDYLLEAWSDHQPA